MRQQCEKCGRLYDDEFCLTVCPHRGIGFCVVCDCALCVCDPQTTNERSAQFAKREAESLRKDEPGAVIAEEAKPRLTRLDWIAIAIAALLIIGGAVFVHVYCRP